MGTSQRLREIDVHIRLMELMKHTEVFQLESLQGFVDFVYAWELCQALDGRHLTVGELNEFLAVSRQRRAKRTWPLSDGQRMANSALGSGFVSPAKLRTFLFGHIDFNGDQRRILDKILWSQSEFLRECPEDVAHHPVLLFPGHPSITPRFLYNMLGYDRHRPPYFGGVDDGGACERGAHWWLTDEHRETLDSPLELRWYLVPTICSLPGTPETETRRYASFTEVLLASILTYYLKPPGFGKRGQGLARERAERAIGWATIECGGRGVEINGSGQISIQRSSRGAVNGPLMVRRLPDGL